MNNLATAYVNRAGATLCRRALARGLPLALGASLSLPIGASPIDAAGGAAQGRPMPEAATETDTDRMLSNTRQGVRLAAESLARGVDSWFGDRPFEDGGKVSEGRLSLHLLSRQGEPLDHSLRLHARWQLPNLGERSYLYLGRGDRRELVTNKPEALTRAQQLQPERVDNRGFFAGLGITLRDAFDLRLGFRGGLKPYAQASYRRDWLLGPADRLDFRETLFWTLDDHFGSTTALSWEHAVMPTLTLRWLNAATISQRVRHFDWSSNLGAYKSYGRQRLLSLEVLASGLEGSGVDVADYGLQAKWEQPIHRDWLIGEVLVGHFWPKRDAVLARETAWALGLGLRMNF